MSTQPGILVDLEIKPGKYGNVTVLEQFYPVDVKPGDLKDRSGQGIVRRRRAKANHPMPSQPGSSPKAKKSE